eukprot:1138897-Pelagomonas_calceolata.AAC.2
MSGKAQLNQMSDGVVIIDSACHTQVVKGVSVRAELKFHKVDISVVGRYHLRVEMGGSPLDRSHKCGIRMALMPGKGASTIGKSPV